MAELPDHDELCLADGFYDSRMFDNSVTSFDAQRARIHGQCATIAFSAKPWRRALAAWDIIRLFEAPTSTARVVRDVDRSHRLLELRREGDWVKVAVFRMVDARGWVRSADVAAERDVADQPPAGPDLEFAGFVLDQAVAEARAISCVVRKAEAPGRLRVTLLVGGLPVAAGGTLGPARAIRGSVAVALPKMAGPSRTGRTIVSPMGDPVPALRMRIESKPDTEFCRSPIPEARDFETLQAVHAA